MKIIFFWLKTCLRWSSQNHLFQFGVSIQISFLFGQTRTLPLQMTHNGHLKVTLDVNVGGSRFPPLKQVQNRQSLRSVYFFLPFLHKQPSIICQQVVLRYFRSEMQNSSAMLTLRVFTIIYVRCNGFFFFFNCCSKMFIYLPGCD